MKPYSFFTYLLAHLKIVQKDGAVIFGNNVFLVPTFPTQQMPSMISPTCLVMDNGASPYSSHSDLVEQSFTIGFWVSKVDRYGEAGVLKFLEIEEALYADLRDLKTLNSEKVNILENSKKAFQLTSNNYPLMSRYWSFSVILTI